MAIALIIRVHSDGGIAEDRLRARGGDRQMRAALDRVAEIIERDFFFVRFHLEVGDGCLQARAPIHEAWSAIDQACSQSVMKA